MLFLYCFKAGLLDLESLNLDSCHIQDEGLVHLAGSFPKLSFYVVESKSTV